MEEQIILPPEFNEHRKPSSVYSRLGFGIAITTFILVLVEDILFSLSSNYENVTRVIVLGIMTTALFGGIAFIFSVVGLIVDNINNSSKRSGVWGIILVCLSLLISVAVPFAYRYYDLDIEMSTLRTSDSLVKSDDVMIVIEKNGKIKCYDRRYNNDISPANMHAGPFLSEEIGVWLDLNDIEENQSIALKVEDNADFSDVTCVVEALQDNGIKNYWTITKNNRIEE